MSGKDIKHYGFDEIRTNGENEHNQFSTGFLNGVRVSIGALSSTYKSLVQDNNAIILFKRNRCVGTIQTLLRRGYMKHDFYNFIEK